MEETLIILKPDCVRKRLVGEVISRFEDAGFEIIAARVMQLEPDLLREHYAHVADKPFYPEIEAFMSERPVIVMLLRGPDAVDRVRRILGPTNSKEAPKGTIRGDLGEDMMRNVVHASDSAATAAAEKKRFFPDL
ncbi:MAG: nucleoside-diphosphate kinase [Opitutales bacterium]